MGLGERAGRDPTQRLEPHLGGAGDQGGITAVGREAEHPARVAEIDGVDAEPFTTRVESHGRIGRGGGRAGRKASRTFNG